MRRIPVVATLVVLAAVAAMVTAGVWQLQRATWKENLLGRYNHAVKEQVAVAYPFTDDAREEALYHHSRIDCRKVLSQEVIAGRNLAQEVGWAQIARCATSGEPVEVALGWSKDPATRVWQGGTVEGMIGPAARNVRLVVAPAQAGLTQLARPDPHDVPNNHRSYAVQWFLFAASALIIYVLALRSKLKDSRKDKADD
jgi:surfeit locus 1 family protein